MRLTIRLLFLLTLSTASLESQTLVNTITGYGQVIEAMISPEEDLNGYGGQFALAKGNIIDIYRSPLGPKVATINMPSVALYSQRFTVSQKWVDSDNEWEISVSYIDTAGGSYQYRYKILDDDNRELLHESGYPFYFTDGVSTYVYNSPYYSSEIKTWRLRSDVFIRTTELPSKKAVVNGASIHRSPSQIRFSSADETGRFSGFACFDMQGRQIFDITRNRSGQQSEIAFPTTGIPIGMAAYKYESNGEKSQSGKLPIVK